MVDTTDIISEFESILKQQNFVKPLIYTNDESDEENNEKAAENKESNLSAQTIISNVAKQIKALQNSEYGKCERKNTTSFNLHKEQSFLPLNMLREPKTSPHQMEPLKFETELFSDTQLINVVQNAEAMDGHTGVTQEFDTTFHNSDEDEDDDTSHSPDTAFPILDITLKEPSLIPTAISISNQNEYSTTINEAEEICDVKEDYSTQNCNLIDSNMHILNECIEIVDSDTSITSINQEMAGSQCSQRPASPIFNVKTKKIKSERGSPIICDVDTFENFAKIALPIIEETINKDEAKILVNSQVVASEFSLRTNFGHKESYKKILEQIGVRKSASPIIEMNNEPLKIDKETLLKNKHNNFNEEPVNKDVGGSKSKESSQSDKSVFKDEILFSSDEEDDYLQHSYKDLPFTCALETSFYDTFDVNKTMFVGFQTASNKSIQIDTDSFYKAKSLLGSVEEEINNKDTLTQLVKKCDNISSITELIDVKDNISNSNPSLHDTVNGATGIKPNIEDLNESTLQNVNNIELVNNNDAKSKDFCDKNSILFNALTSPHKFRGFKTASNKDIQLSEKAILKSKALFQDMDIAEEDSVAYCKPDPAELGLIESLLDDEIKKEYSENSNKESLDKIQKDNKVEEIVKNDEENNHEFLDDLINIEVEEILQLAEQFESGCKPQPNETIDAEAPKTEFVGFKTASNKKIHISDAALTRSKKLLQDDLEIVTETQNATKSHENSEAGSNTAIFKTASNKNITIPDAALERVKIVLSDINLSEIAGTDNTNDNEQMHNKESNYETSVRGLAQNKDIVREGEEFLPPFYGFNDHDLKSAKDILIKSQKTIIHEALNQGEDKEPPFHGFNDQDLESVEETLIKSQKILEKFGCESTTNVDLKKLPNNSKFPGFKTASNKPVIFSEKAITNSNNIFKDLIDVTESENVSIKTVIVFKTASNKHINISEKALAKSRKLFQGLDDDCADSGSEMNSVKNTNNNNTIASSSQTIQNGNDKKSAKMKYEEKFVGFQTASNKKVNISEVALEKSKKLFEDMSEDIEMVRNLEGKSGTVKKDFKFGGFQTASNKNVEISAAALAKSKKLFDDIDNNEHSIHIINKPSKSEGKCRGFKTASNKTVAVSNEALAKTKNIFKDIDLADNFELNTDKNTKLDAKYKSQGFQTANNKKIKISTDALAKTKNIFKFIDEDVSKCDTNDIRRKEAPFEGFKTASSKKVKISEHALAKSKKIFQSIDDISNIESSKDVTESDSYKKDLLFQTKISNIDAIFSKSVSPRSRNLVQKVLTNDLVEKTKPLKTQSTEKPLKFGFQSASNKQVKISEDSLVKSKEIFQNIDDSSASYLDKDASRIPKFSGFQTANNEDVKISKEALARSREMLLDIDIANQDLFKGCKGFQTASNKEVIVSEEAVAKSRQIFEDIDITQSKIVETEKRKDHRDRIPKKSDKPKIAMDLKQRCSENFDNVDTQLLQNFNESMHEITPKNSKRSSSPILSCPKAKKRKFQIPYSQKSPIKTKVFKPPNAIQKPENVYQFNGNYKKVKKYNLKDLQHLETLTNFARNVDDYLLSFKFETLLNIEFKDERNDITKSTLNLPDLMNIFLNSVNKKLVPDGWLDIQIKLILWKLISYEISFPNTMHLICSAKNVLEQLKYRYDRELYNAERPALRKIFEKDDTPLKTLVFCVVAIVNQEDSTQTPELILTDGWYTIKAVIDKMLAKLINAGKISVGTKLATHGAELIGSEQAVSPWEDTSSIRLKISGNSTRRAFWNARLGYHGNAAILSQLSNVAIDGGKISKLRVFVARVYPALYVDKFEDGSTVTRSERLEHIHQMRYESERQAALEKIYEEVEREVLDQDSQDSEEATQCGVKRKCLDSGSQIAKVMRRSKDPGEFRSHLTSTQMALLEDHSTKEREKLLQTIQSKVQDKMAAKGLNLNRNVVTLLKIRVAGVEVKKNGVEVTKALLSIWRPNEAVLELIREGIWIEILNVTPTAMRYSELQLSAGRQSMFIQSKFKEDTLKLYTKPLKRNCYELQDLVKNPSMTTDYNEVDTVGVIFQIDPTKKDFIPNKNQFQNVYLSDIDKNIISINFWGGLDKFGFGNVLDTGQVIACTNLQKRAGNSRKNIPQYRVTEFTYFTKTPKNDEARKMTKDLDDKLCRIDRKQFIEDCVIAKDNYIQLQNNDNVTPYRLPNIDVNSARNKVFIDSPLEQRNNKKIDENIDLTGLDFDSTFKQTDSQDLSPKTLLRKRQVRERIAKLKRYGEPPPLSPIQIRNKSRDAGKAFKSPLIPKSDVSGVASVEEKLPNQEEMATETCIESSPVICLNRTYVKRSNPVKLNFSKDEEIDEFAEEFDYSPPLSLD